MFIRAVGLFVGCMLCASAGAVVTPLDTAPVHAPANVRFPVIRFALTDVNGAPVPGGKVEGQLTGNLAPDGKVCAREGFYDCFWTAGSDGIVQIDGIVAARAGTYPLLFQSPYGYTIFTFIADPLGTPGKLTIVSGADQRAVLGETFAQPIVVRATHADGSPIVGREIYFLNAYRVDVQDDYPPTTHPYAVVPFAPIVTDSNGFATSPKFTVTEGIGLGYVQVDLYEPQTASDLRVRVPFHSTTKDGAETVALQNLWWGGAAENGWGLALMQHGADVYPILFTYDDAGHPTWLAATGNWYFGLGSTFDARYFSTIASPFFAYDPARLAIVKTLGQLDLVFDNAATDHLAFTMQPNLGPGIRKTLRPQDISGARLAPLQGLGDLWWGGEKQNGWGIAMIEQPGGLVSIWFTYDALGVPTWFIMPNGTWTDDRTYSGAIYRTTGMPLSANYDASRFHAEVAGEFTYRFSDTGHATFEYRVDDKSGAVPITREPF